MESFKITFVKHLDDVKIMREIKTEMSVNAELWV